MKSQNYRTFIGLPLRVDQVFLQTRHNLMAALKEERISWTNPDQYHVTLRFIGDTELSLIKKIGSALHSEIAVPERIRLETCGLASFGPRKRPRVIWVGFDESSFFDLLKFEVDRVLELCGIPSTEQAFKAHLTLGRVRSLQNLQSYYLTVEEMNQQFNSSVIFEKLVFFRSILGPLGPEYQVLDEIKFRL
ncbi:MAG: RNA 2',3'-cyclic phosphodiesterase [Bacteroidales bacterium]|nr:RNA 2',3'-cyclic phosphodiesterase [Bacteroidales bacterium]